MDVSILIILLLVLGKLVGTGQYAVDSRLVVSGKVIMYSSDLGGGGTLVQFCLLDMRIS
jgi:hypothetical protein